MTRQASVLLADRPADGLPAARIGERPLARLEVLAGLAVATAVAASAVVLRGWDLGAAYASGDQATLGVLIRHQYGIGWVFERSYGPVCETANRIFAGLLSVMRVPMSEATDRWPTLLVGLAQVGMTYPLLRRLRRPAADALAGTAVAAVLPVLVCDCRLTWAWGYLSIWLLTGTVGLWAGLAYLDERRWWQLALAGVALMLHCLSNVYAFALPAALMAMWIGGLRRRSPGAGVRAWEAAAGFVLPCAAALAGIGLCWWLTGEGQIGHLLAKQERGTAGLQWDQIGRMPAMWATQFGYLTGLIAAAALVLGTVCTSWRIRLLVIWAWLGLWPVWLLADWDRIGYPAAYFIETSYAAGLLGAIAVCAVWRRLAGHRRLRGVAAAIGVLAWAQTAIGTADDCVGKGRWASWTGIANKPAELRRDIGAKAAGWYVRTHVPIEAAILCLHDNKGMEAAVAEYYLGRRVLAGFDLDARMMPRVLAAARADADVIIVDGGHRGLVEGAADFRRVCTIRHGGDGPIRCIYARPSLNLPAMDREVSAANGAYDAAYRPRHVPIPLPAGRDFERKLGRYQKACKDLKRDTTFIKTN